MILFMSELIFGIQVEKVFPKYLLSNINVKLALQNTDYHSDMEIYANERILSRALVVESGESIL